ncbi:hypothetical protein [Streptomyces showdoensis]|uniref:Uncharacterized protein n=1 Tax=Streptomyces showdoensis TaxID=68268 RepID=A0A2P2GKR0_STREW|nr:hypothetical protein [Streptomyces showdoensis]KKZ72087.1 hypothetical protein VO63_20115 [Streptomyces showdoensis]
MTTHPTTLRQADQALTARAVSSAQFLAGVLAAAELDVVGQPDKLPELLFPDLDAEAVRRVWNTALTVGYRLRKLAEQPRWDDAALRRLRGSLTEAGYTGMGQLAERSLNTLHPADTDVRTARDRT